MLGIALIGYGVIGIVLFVVVAFAVSRPLERAQALGASVEEQRAGVINTLEQAQVKEAIIRTANAATGRATAIGDEFGDDASRAGSTT